MELPINLLDEYEYTPLDQSKQQIRLLTPLPGSEGEAVRGTLHSVTLSKDNVPQYEALSYAWGDPDDRECIALSTLRDTSTSRIVRSIQRHFLRQEIVAVSINGIPRRRRIKRSRHWIKRSIHRNATPPPHFEKLAVTRNLYTALLHLRDTTRRRILWIDAICVNQRDLAERSRQVTRMANIFTYAERVIAWIGEADSATERAMELIKLISTKVGVDAAYRTISLISKDPNDAHWVDLRKKLPFNRADISSLCHLWNRPWFGRLWIWQEIQRANRSSLLMCGHNRILWQSFRTAMLLLSLKPISADSIPQNLWNYWDSRETALTLCTARIGTSFCSLATATRRTQCSDPRDRVYALLSMEGLFSLYPTIVPDYSKTVKDVYEQAIMSSIAWYRDLTVLRLCELSPSHKEEMPSWVADLRRPSSTQPLAPSSSISSTLTEVPEVRDRVLKLKGVQLATVVSSHGSLFELGSKFHLEQLLNAMGNLFNLVPKDSLYLNGESMSEAICRSSIANVFAESFSPPSPSFPKERLVAPLIQSILDHSDQNTARIHILGEFQDECELYLSRIRTAQRGRTIFTSDKGYIGIAPESVMPGDRVVQLLGSRDAVFLRPKGKSRYLLVGHGYCHGAADGVAFLGPLPSYFRFVTRLSSHSNGHLTRFHDKQKNILQLDDPRLGSLPEGWDKEYYIDNDGDECLKFVNHITGEVWFAEHHDPRTTQAELEKRGVKFEDFHLI